ncbi:MAG: hypothetical protein ABI460_06875 [Caldimonas sp.]
MTLHTRLATLADLPRAYELILAGGRGIHDAATLERLPVLWRELLVARRLEMHVFVDDALPEAERIQGVASGAWVSDAFADGLIGRGGEPGAARRMIEAERSGRSVILTREQAAQANRDGGVNGVGFDFAFAHVDWTLPRALRWTPMLLESGRLWLDGWKLRMAVRECFGRDLYLMVRAMGVTVFHRHTKRDGRLLAPDQRRYLTGITRERARRMPVALATMMFFTDRVPRFRFTRAEQDLLLLALRNHDDDACAAELHLSSHTIKTRWRSIFAHVAEQQPEWFPSDEAADGRRGVAKRRHLLAYLTKHMEEVRPRAPDPARP